MFEIYSLTDRTQGKEKIMNLEKRKDRIEKELAGLHTNRAGKDGRLAVIERMNLLFDRGSFIETDAFISESANFLNGEKASIEGVVTGYGAVEGRLVFVFSQDYSRNKGALGLEGARKIARLYDMALENGAPVIGVYDSDGAKLQEGTNALAAYGIVLNAVAKAEGKIPRISLIAGNCTGANAISALQSDFQITASVNALLSLSPPSVLEAAGEKESIKATENRAFPLVSLKGETEEEGLKLARKLLSYLPSNKKNRPPLIPNNDPAERQMGDILGLAENFYDMRALLAELVDKNSLFELNSDFGKDFIIGLALINGGACGIIASNPLENEGRITAEGAEKAAGFIRLCNAFSLPAISLVDSAGYAPSSELKKPDMARQIADLTSAYASASTPLITVIVGRAIGSVFSVLGSKMLGADLVLALPSAQIAVMETESAINFLWNDKLAEADDAKSVREDLKTRWEQEISGPLNAAENGHIDFICNEKDLRARIASGLSMLSMKQNFKDFK